MGFVYRVYHQGWGIDLAVKSPRPKFFQTQSEKEDFIREAETWVNLGMHPNIVNCYYTRTLGGVPRVFVEYISDGSLSEWIRKQKLYKDTPNKNLEKILDISIQIAWGLHYAHQQGVVHQDVKPSNIMISFDGKAKITDFGLARMREDIGKTKEKKDLSSGKVLGAGLMTRAYCSPEQLNSQPLSYKTDIWSWGVSILEMFYGEPPCRYGGHMASAVLESYLEIGTEEEYLPAIPSKLADILRRCFQKDPKMRPQNLLNIADGIQEIYKKLFGRNYFRPPPKSTEVLADSLNNRALSYLDLGKNDQAYQAWKSALINDRQHPETIYNLGVEQWRNGKLTDDALIKQLQSVMINKNELWQAKHLLALVHLERGDLNAAYPLIIESKKQASDESTIKATVKLVESGNIPAGYCLKAFEGHEAGVTAVSISKNGRFALSGSADGTLRLWETETGKCLRVFEGHKGDVLSVCLSNDGKFALSGSQDHTLRLWDISSGKCIRIFEGHTCWVRTVCLSADGCLALSAGGDNYGDPKLKDEPFSLRLWDVKTGRCLRIIQGHVNIVKSVHLSADGSLAISAGDDWSMRFWNLTTGQCLGTRQPHNFWVETVHLSEDTQYVLSGSGDVYNRDNTLRLWDGVTGELLRTFEGHSAYLNSVCLTKDNNFALSGSNDKTVRLWETATGRCLRTFIGHSQEVTSVSISDNGRFALSGSKDRTICLWELPIPSVSVCGLHLSRPWSHSELQNVKSNLTGLIKKAKKLIQEGNLHSSLKYLNQARELPGCEHESEILDVWTSLYPHSYRKGLRSAWAKRIFEGHTTGVMAVCATEDCQLIISGCGDLRRSIHGEFVEQSLKVWDVTTGRCLQTLEGNFTGLSSLCLNQDGDLALIGTGGRMVKESEKGGFCPAGESRKTLQLWDMNKGEFVRFFEGHQGWTGSACFSPDGQFALSGGGDKTLRLWEVSSGRCLRVFRGHKIPTEIDSRQQLLKMITGSVETVCFSSDMRFALSGSSDMSIMFWDVSTGHYLKKLIGHSHEVTSVCLSSDGQYALSGSLDGTLRWWNLMTGDCCQILKGHSRGITSVCLSSDGQFAVSGSQDNTLRLWKISSGECIWIFEGHTNRVTSIFLSSNNRYLVSGSEDNTVRLWELDWDIEIKQSKNTIV